MKKHHIITLLATVASLTSGIKADTVTAEAYWDFGLLNNPTDIGMFCVPGANPGSKVQMHDVPFDLSPMTRVNSGGNMFIADSASSGNGGVTGTTLSGGANAGLAIKDNGNNQNPRMPLHFTNTVHFLWTLTPHTE